VRPELSPAEQVAAVVRRCPTGALHYRLADGSDEPAEIPTRVAVRAEGAIWIRGDLRLETPEGVITERRAALCGCGRTAMRPFCDGACVRGDEGPGTPER
jgi:CDGSH-type Zn-finger protein